MAHTRKQTVIPICKIIDIDIDIDIHKIKYQASIFYFFQDLLA